MKKILKILINLYRDGISSYRTPCCRFIPSCSEYALEAIEKHGAFKGSWLSLRRILRCSPLTKHNGFYDPVP